MFLTTSSQPLAINKLVQGKWLKNREQRHQVCCGEPPAHQDHIWTQMEKFLLGKHPPHHGTQTKYTKVLLTVPWAHRQTCFISIYREESVKPGLQSKDNWYTRQMPDESRTDGRNSIKFRALMRKISNQDNSVITWWAGESPRTRCTEGWKTNSTTFSLLGSKWESWKVGDRKGGQGMRKGVGLEEWRPSWGRERRGAWVVPRRRVPGSLSRAGRGAALGKESPSPPVVPPPAECVQERLPRGTSSVLKLLLPQLILSCKDD